jgi:hypothetical protein
MRRYAIAAQSAPPLRRMRPLKPRHFSVAGPGAEKPGSDSVRNIETEATFAIEESSRGKSIDAMSLPDRNLRWRSSHLHRQRLSRHTVCSGFDGDLDYAPTSKRRKE